MIEIENCWFEYGRHLPPVFERLSLQHPDGPRLGTEVDPLIILGPAQAGKSTLMRLLASHARPARGTVRVLGIDAGRRPLSLRRRVAYVPQVIGLPEDLTLTEYLGELARLDHPAATPRDVTLRVRRSIDAVHLADAANRRLRAFSGGMKRRALLAQALLGDAGVLLVDTPTAGLDPYEQMTVLNLLRAEGRRRLVVVATARPREAAALPGRCLLLDHGEIVADLPSRQLADAGHTHVFELPGSFREHIPTDNAGWVVPTRRADTVLVVAERAPDEAAKPASSDPELGFLYLLWRARGRRSA